MILCRQLQGQEHKLIVASAEKLYWEIFRSYNKMRGYKAVAAHANGSCDEEMEFLEVVEYVYPKIQEWLCYVSGSKCIHGQKPPDNW